MRLHPARAVGLLRAPWIPGWSKDPLWRRARAVPSLDLRFADNKSLVDATTGANLVTFSRASGATYVDSQGVIRNAVTNLLLRSEEFDQSPWTANVSPSTTPNATISPIGSVTADLIAASATSSGYYQPATVISGAVYTLSYYIKAAPAATDPVVRVGFGGNLVLFDTSLGLATPIGAIWSSASAQPVGNGWYRVSMTGTATTTSYAVVVYGNSSGSQWYIWGAQLEQSSTVGEYIPTGATINSAPRFDHNPTTGESLGLLVEESRTNLLTHSEVLDDASWVKSECTITANGIAAPNGSTTADKIIDNTNNALHFTIKTLTVTANTNYAYTVYVKKGEYSNVRIRYGKHLTPFTRIGIIYNFDTGTITNSDVDTPTSATVRSATPLKDGWVRLCVAGIFDTTSTDAQIEVTLVDNSGNAVFTGTGSSGTFAWGAQLEAGAFPTSYIPTEGTTVTRAADVASISGSNFSSWYKQSEGTVFADTASIYNGGRYFMFDDGTTNERWEGRYASYLAAANSWSNSVQDVSLNTNVIGVTPSTNVRLAIANASNNAAIASNGTDEILGTDSSSTMPANQSRLFIGSFQGTATFANGPIRRLVYWGQRLPNSVLQTITQ